jgi:hypothetical protein
MFQQVRAGFGQLQRPPDALKQQYAEIRFECSNLTAEGGLGQAQMARRG